MAGVAKYIKGFPRGFPTCRHYAAWRTGLNTVNAYYLIVGCDAISGSRFRSTQIENLNRRDPVPAGSADPRGNSGVDP